MKESIKKQSIIPRIDDIMRDIEKLKELSEIPFDTFKSEKKEYFVLAQFYLRQALEGVFHISEHILSRSSGGRATEYKEIAKKLGEIGIVDMSFAQSSLVKMAGYRNRLTHFYAEITPEEIYQIIDKDLKDFYTFLKKIKYVLEHSEEFGFTVE
jgi:uncharacterized protein YutE (UPF0331/DUF86 family)